MRNIQLLETLSESLDQVILRNGCARAGRVEYYLSLANKLGIPRHEIELPKLEREPKGAPLTKQEIEANILGNTFRRPCFDMVFLPTGVIRACWNDGLWDTQADVSAKMRNRLGLPAPVKISDAVPIVHEGTWEWSKDGNGILRKFDIYPNSFLTEFFIQENGLLTIKGHNDTDIIWYDVMPLRGDQLPKQFVPWSEIAPFTDIEKNLHWERVYNSGPQQKPTHAVSES